MAACLGILISVKLRDEQQVYPPPVPCSSRGRRYIRGPDGLRSARERFQGQDPERRICGDPEGVACAERVVCCFGASLGVSFAAGSPAAGRRGEYGETWVGFRLRLCRPEVGRGGAWADDLR